ncbi:MAG: hypothetical protein IT514_01340 [Burkholderiales bacterium]|nr:hypothetical protein [Burkholderiales bacterium]
MTLLAARGIDCLFASAGSDFGPIIEALAGAHGEKVTAPDALIPALERALTVVTADKRQALLNVVCS